MNSEFILGIGCSFTWGESLYFYSDLPNLPFVENHSYDSSKVTPEMIEFKNNNRYLKLISDEIDLPYINLMDENNGGSLIGAAANLQYDIKTKHKNAKYVIWQLTDWTRDFNRPDRNLHDYDDVCMFKMINGHIQQAVHFIKYVVEEFEKNGSHVILFSWHSDLVEHPLYQELFVKTGKHMNIECEGTTFTAFDEIIKSDLDKYAQYTVAYDFRDIGMAKNDTHFNIKGQHLLKTNILNKIKKIKLNTLI